MKTHNIYALLFRKMKLARIDKKRKVFKRFYVSVKINKILYNKNVNEI